MKHPTPVVRSPAEPLARDVTMGADEAHHGTVSHPHLRSDARHSLTSKQDSASNATPACSPFFVVADSQSRSLDSLPRHEASCVITIIEQSGGYHAPRPMPSLWSSHSSSPIFLPLPSGVDMFRSLLRSTRGQACSMEAPQAESSASTALLRAVFIDT